MKYIVVSGGVISGIGKGTLGELAEILACHVMQR